MEAHLFWVQKVIGSTPIIPKMEYLFYGLILISALMVLVTKNPVHSVLFLVLAFFNSTMLLILWEMEFLALILILIYVGAIAILFLFVIMMLNIRSIEQEENQMRYLPFGAAVACIFFFELYLIIEEVFPVKKPIIPYVTWEKVTKSTPSMELLGTKLYVEMADVFLIASLVLLLAMMGALILSLSKRKSGVVAQLVELLFCIQKVTGSIPANSTALLVKG